MITTAQAQQRKARRTAQTNKEYDVETADGKIIEWDKQ
jgi:hypothetical protein